MIFQSVPYVDLLNAVLPNFIYESRMSMLLGKKQSKCTL